MNAIAPIGQNAPASPSRPSKAQTVAKSLQHIRENLLAPFDSWERLRASVPANDSRGERIIPMMVTLPTIRQPTSDADRDAQRDRAEWPLIRQPDPDEVRAHLAIVEGALQAPFDLRQTRFILGLMIDAFPNARPHNPDGYLETVVDIVHSAGPSPTVVASACDEIKRTFKFLPSAAEVLEKVIEAEKYLTLMRRLSSNFLRDADHINEQIKWLEHVPLYDETVGGERLRPPAPAAASLAPTGSSERVTWV